MSEKIGVIGLGRMGSALAARAASEGLETIGWTRSGGDAEVARAAGYDLASDLAALVSEADILLLSLFDGAAVEAVLGTLASLPLAGKLVVETSTVAPDIVRRHAAAIEAAGGRLIDAPVSGGPEMVLSGTMGLFIGGREADVALFMPVAEKLSNRIAHIGALGAGAAAKIVNNVALAGAYGAAVEAMRLGQAMGLDLPTMLDFLEKSPGTSPMFKSRVPMIGAEDAPVGFSIDGAVKDAEVFLSAGRTAGVELPAMNSTNTMMLDGQAGGLGGKDVAAIVRHVLEKSAR